MIRKDFCGDRITPAYAGNTTSDLHSCKIIWDHPRIRGEHVVFVVLTVQSLGSPPHTRGTLYDIAIIIYITRITPAYAGNTQRLYRRLFYPRDHPRIRGEHYHWITDFRKCRRITPAYAGNTRTDAKERINLKDHPRIRGEHAGKSILVDESLGSPPHTRGTHFLKAENQVRDRITPAYAGNTTCKSCLCHHRRDHPRIRGEHKQILKSVRKHGGSPPHTRGTLTADSISDLGLRITPAYAGNTKLYALF